MKISGPVVLTAIMLFCACAPSEAGNGGGGAATARLPAYKAVLESTRSAKAEAGAIMKRIKASPGRFEVLLGAVTAAMAADPGLLCLVDKNTGLSADFVPQGLTGLDGSGLSVAKKGLNLRKPVMEALFRMDKAARSEGIVLVVSSTYRSYAYQTEVFARNVKEMGESEASRVSARPGQSQHQLGTAIDFGSIDNSFAKTKAGIWLEANASRFGFSQSYPRGLEPVTGYLWESWHYRYIGLEAAALQKEYFGGVQQYLMEFLAGLGR